MSIGPLSGSGAGGKPAVDDPGIGALAEMGLGGGDAAAELDRNSDIAHGHLGAGKRAQDHELVQIAEMTDAEHLARDPGEPDAEREIVAPVGLLDDGVAVET